MTTTTRDRPIGINVDGQRINGTLVLPAKRMPGVLFVHGWGGSPEKFLMRAREVANLGCVCLTFDLRGHAETKDQFNTVSREQNLADVVAAYDALAQHPEVDPSAIAVAGSSYGGYLACILAELRPIRWLALRVPALYKDEDWCAPKEKLRDKQNLEAYRRQPVHPDECRALRSCTAFQGDVMIVESEHDTIVPHQVIVNYRAAFTSARSLTYRMMKGADHGLSRPEWQLAYNALLVNWIAEMLGEMRSTGDDTHIMGQSLMRKAAVSTTPTPDTADAAA